MTNAQIDRVLAGDPSFGVVPLVFAKAVKGAVDRRAQAEAPSSPVVVVAPPPAGPGAATFALVSLVALGAGFGVGYMVGRR